MAASKEIWVTVELRDTTKFLQIPPPDCSIKTLYDRVASKMAQSSVNTFNLLSHGEILDTTKQVGDYHFMHLQNITCIHKTLGGSSGLQPLAGYITVTDEPDSLTYDDNPDEMRAKMPCGCVVSIGTVAGHCSTSIEKGVSTFKCPVCEAPWEFFLVRHILSTVMSDQQLIDISRRLDENFVSTPQNDIRQCGMCKTYCMRDFNRQSFRNRNRVVCNVCTGDSKGRRVVEFCWLCSQEWRGGDGPDCANDSCGPPAVVRMLSTCPTKKINAVTEVPNTRACPRCGTLMMHVERCKHVQCKSCRLRFCFVCLKPQDAQGRWQCGEYSAVCPVAPRQTVLPSNSAPLARSTVA